MAPAAGRATPAKIDVRFVGQPARHTASPIAVASASGEWNWPAVSGGRVVPVVYDERGGYGNAGRGAASMQSIVVTETGQSYQIAQSDEPDADFGAELQRQLETPFGGTAEELPPIQDGSQDAAPEPDPLDDLMGDLSDEGPAGGFDVPTIDTPAIEAPSAPGAEAQSGPPAGDQFGDLPMQPAPEAFDPPSADSFGHDGLDSGGFDDGGFDDAFDGGSMDNESIPPGEGADGGADGGDDEATAKRRRESAKSCAEERAELKASRLSMIDLYIGVSGEEGMDYPFTCSVDDGTPYQPRCWEQVIYMWKASALCHKPLYFEQKHLERYGHSWGPYLDPVVAGAHFFTRLPALPYCMGLKTPNECVYTLGDYRPGSCAPYMIEQPGITCRAVGFGLGAWTGGVFAIP
ncbi:MAG: hypothetical protein AAGB00_09485 [Planctomycetota bacterium]